MYLCVPDPVCYFAINRMVETCSHITLQQHPDIEKIVGEREESNQKVAQRKDRVQHHRIDRNLGEISKVHIRGLRTRPKRGL